MEENYLWDRAFFFLIIFIHVLISYGSGTFRTHIPRKTLDMFFALEYIVLLCVAIYSCCTTPIRATWYVALAGYLLVFAIVAMSKSQLSQYVIVPQKEYVMEIEYKVKADYTNKKHLKGYITEGRYRVYVVLYDDHLYDACNEENHSVKVRFKKFTSKLGAEVVVETC